jgi:DNA-binding NarL/FixJ family response regulator
MGAPRRLPAVAHLTDRDRQVLESLTRGLDNQAIAAEMRLSPRTVRNYLSRAYDKIGVGTRLQAVLWVQENLHEAGEDR